MGAERQPAKDHLREIKMKTSAKIVLPPRVRVWSKDNWHIYFDPHNFIWVKVNESGRFLMELFRQHLSPEEVTVIVSQKFDLPVSKAEESIELFIQTVANAGFIHIGEYQERERREFTQLEFPQYVYVHLTYNCNLKCPYCYNKTDRETKIELQKAGLVAPTLSTDEFKHVIRRTIECGVKRLMFTGGEPLMRPDVLELIAFARECSETVQLEVLTNAILINDEVAEHLCRYVNGVTISLDGHEKHIHEYYRGKNTFAPTVRGIKTLVNKRRELKQKSPYISIVPAITERNIINTKEIFEFSLDQLGADGLAPIIFQAGDHQSLNITQIPALSVYIEEMGRTVQYLKARAEQKSKEGNSAARLPSVSPRNHCGVGHGEISLDPGGFVYPCQSLHYDEFICGNVREDDIQTIFTESPTMKRMRGMTVDEIPVCSHCDIRYLCNAGCRATAYNVYREFDAHNEIYCKFLETLAVEKLWGATHVSLSPT